MKDEKEEAAEVAVETPTGRAAILEAFRAANPDMEGDPEDDALFGFAHDRYGKVSEANTRLAERVAADPRAGAMLAMFTGEGKSLPYAMASVYGKDWLDGEMEDFEAGYQENLKRLAESKAEQEQAAKNIEQYRTTLATFAKDNDLDEAQLATLDDAIYTTAENFLMGIIPAEFIEGMWKGMNHDKDVEEAAATGFVEGKNDAIDMKKRKDAIKPLPDLASGSGAGKPRVAPEQKERINIFKQKA